MSGLMKRRRGGLLSGKNRRVKAQEESRPQRLTPGVRQGVRYLMSLVLAFGVCVGGYLGWQSLHESPRLQVQRVVVKGVDRIESEEVEAYLGEVEGQRMLDLDLDALALELRHHPWIDEVTVRRRLPHTLVVDVVEFEAAIFVSLKHVYVANREGNLFKRLSSRDALAFPVLTGLSVDGTEVDSERTREVVMQAIEIVESVGEHGDVLGRVEEIHFDQDLGWSVVSRPLTSSGGVMRVHLGSLPLRRVSIASEVVRELKKMKRDPEVVWVDGIKNPDRVHIRLRTARSLKQAAGMVAAAR